MKGDTTPEIDARLRALYAAKSPGERLRMATSAFAGGKRLVTAGLRADGGAIDAAELRRRLLERLHGPLGRLAALMAHPRPRP